MEEFMSAKEYIQSWQRALQPFFRKYILIEEYYNKLVLEMEELINCISSSTFWELFPRLLGIDARLALLAELVDLLLDDNLGLAPEELIEWVEKDYSSYTKELCGYNLNSRTNYSFIFQVK